MQTPTAIASQPARMWECIGQQLRTFLPVYFSMVMATGIVSIAVHRSGIPIAGAALLWLNAAIYVIFWMLLVARVSLAPLPLLRELTNFKLAPAFFTIVAGTSVLARELLIIDMQSRVART